MDIDLNRSLVKVTTESERSIKPEETYKRALESINNIGIDLEFTIKEYDTIFWISDANAKFRENMPSYDYHLRMGGKGPSKEQCLASGTMEFVERWSLHRFNVFDKREFDCFDIKENKTYKIGPVLEMRNTMCVAAGNNYEEAILHCLHELIETRILQASYWQPYKIVPIETLFPDFPDWVKNSIILILSPSHIKEFYHFTAIQYPFNREFDDYRKYKLEKKDNRLIFSPRNFDPKYHGPNSGGAAGLNPRMTAFRAINEIFQFKEKNPDIHSGRKKEIPDYIPIAKKEDLINYETESITDDIKLILKLLGDDVFIGIVDFTEPDLGIPVVKLISDYTPAQSFVSREMMSIFFDF